MLTIQQLRTFQKMLHFQHLFGRNHYHHYYELQMHVSDSIRISKNIFIKSEQTFLYGSILWSKFKLLFIVKYNVFIRQKKYLVFGGKWLWPLNLSLNEIKKSFVIVCCTKTIAWLNKYTETCINNNISFMPVIENF
jgi:hypothetical protein